MKKNALCVTSLYAKNNEFCVTFLNIKSLSVCVGATDRQNSDVLTEIFSQGLEIPSPESEEIPCKYSARDAKSQPRISHSADQGKITKQVFAAGKVCRNI